jgi:hypothetical protein
MKLTVNIFFYKLNKGTKILATKRNSTKTVKRFAPNCWQTNLLYGPQDPKFFDYDLSTVLNYDSDLDSVCL